MSEKDIQLLASKAIQDKQNLTMLLQNLLVKDDTIRNQSYKAIYLISQKHPSLLYSKWSFFSDLLDSDNAYLRLIAVILIANLTKIDTEHKFEEIIDIYFNLLNDSIMVAGHLARELGKIAQAKPDLEPQITNLLLNLNKSTHKHKDLLKSYAIEAFNDYFTQTKNQGEIIAFVQDQLQSSSPKTRKIAKGFIEKWKRTTT